MKVPFSVIHGHMWRMGHPQVLSSVHMRNIIEMRLINVLTPKNDSRYESASFVPSYIYLVVVF